MTPPRIPGRSLGPVLLGLGLALSFAVSGCSGGGGGSATSDRAVAARPQPGSAAGNSLVGGARDGVDGGVDAAADRPEVPGATPEEAIISTGTVVLRSRDVAGARFDVVATADRFGGEVSDEQTDTDGHGRVSTSHLVLRIPSVDFRVAMDALEGVADLRFSGSTTKDVTGKVIDTRVRLRAQRRSIARIETLLARAQDLRDIVLIESELTRRQTELESLEHQSAYLENRTALSTITVDIDRAAASATPDEDHTGFLAGLAAGWHWLSAVAVGLATAAGAVLPWLVVLLVLAVPGWPLARRLRRGRVTPPEEPVEA
jgi:uncharacterized protein DUF4349